MGSTMTDEEIALILKENVALRGMCRAQAIIIKEVFERLPSEWQEQENVQRALHISRKVLRELGEHNHVNECH